jgi:phage shock protein PspC (stress-responsive transcriptional regulator)
VNSPTTPGTPGAPDEPGAPGTPDTSSGSSGPREGGPDRTAGTTGPAWSPPPRAAGSGAPASPSPVPVAPPPARPPLRRPREGRVLAGVGAGLAVHLGIDVTVVRILIVVLTLVTNGLGLVAYLAAAILVPADDGTAVRAAGTVDGRDGTSAIGARDPLFWVGVGLLVLGALLLLNGPLAVDRWFPIRFGPEVLLPLVLIGFGLALWRAGDRREQLTPGPTAAPPVWSAAPAGSQPTPPAATPSSATAPDFTPPTATPPTVPIAPATPASSTSTETAMSTDPRAPGGTTAPPAPHGAAPETGGTTPTSAGGAVPPVWSPPPVGGNRPPQGGGGATAWTPPPAPERPSSLLGRLTFGLALVTVGVLWILDISDAITLGVGRILAACLLVLGLGLLVGGVVGRARWLILPAALLTPVVLLATVLSPMSWAGVDLRTDGVGERSERPASVAEAEVGYQLGAGSLRLDLTGLSLDDLEAAGTTRIAVQVGAGEVVVDLPDDIDATATARAGAGEVTLFGAERSGLGVSRTEEMMSGADAPTIELDVQVGFGSVDVRTVTADRSSDGVGRRSPDGTVGDTTERTGDEPADDRTESSDTDAPGPDAAGARLEPATAGV